MKNPPPSPLKTLLALWVGIGVLAAGFLTHAPELHRTLHSHLDHAGHHHDHAPVDDGTDTHQCLIEMLAGGGADSATVSPAITISFTSFTSLPILEPTPRNVSPRGLLPPGRAPPLV